jgi:hypothetical protein
MTVNAKTFEEFMKDKSVNNPEELTLWLYVYIEEQQFLHGTKFIEDRVYGRQTYDR